MDQNGPILDVNKARYVATWLARGALKGATRTYVRKCNGNRILCEDCVRKAKVVVRYTDKDIVCGMGLVKEASDGLYVRFVGRH